MPFDPVPPLRVWMGLCLALAGCGAPASGGAAGAAGAPDAATGRDAATPDATAEPGSGGTDDATAPGTPDHGALPDRNPDAGPPDAMTGDADTTVDARSLDPDSTALADAARPDAASPSAPPTAPGGPVDVTPQPPAEVTAERVLEGPVDFAAAPRADLWLAGGPEALRTWGPQGALEVGEPRALNVALAWDAETLIVGGPDGLAVVTPAGIAASPLNETLAGGVTGLAPGPEGVEGEDLWIAADGGLYRWHRGDLARARVGELPTASARLAASPRGVWVAADRTIYRLGVADGALQAFVVASDLPADALASDAEDNLWVVSDGDLHQRAPGGRRTHWRLPVPVLDVAASPAAAEVWVRTADGLWHVRDGQFRAQLGLPEVRALACAPTGEAVVGAQAGLFRVLPGRHVLLTDTFDAARRPLAGEGFLEVRPAFPERVTSVSARLDDEAPTALDGPPWLLRLDGDSLPETPHAVEVTVAWNDAPPVSARFEFRVDRPDPPPPPPPPPTMPPTMAPTAPPPPGFAADVAPLFDLRCAQCHGPRGFAHRMDGYARFTAEFENILAVVTDGRMPLPPTPRLTPAQIDLLVAWRAAGFPE